MLFAGKLDKMDRVFDYNFEDGEELRRLHFIIQKELIDGEIYFLLEFRILLMNISVKMN
ncbi:MAG: hypothetical protein MR875_05120 [Methanobrevibacter sp.]|nr:hypothetical protein [Methanobrevibacter sp.]